MSFKKKKKPLPDVGPSYDDGKLSFSGREEMDDLTENEQRMLTFSEMEPVELATHFEDLERRAPARTARSSACGPSARTPSSCLT